MIRGQLCASLLIAAGLVLAQSDDTVTTATESVRLTLQEAEQRALKNHPGIAAAGFNAQATRATVR